ncbi:MAG: DUF4159 domain-containing protein [Acidobacteria bacterium]|nr:DUF4159 domain-containing protein [Acidobacteriota bacterium]
MRFRAWTAGAVLLVIALSALYGQRRGGRGFFDEDEYVPDPADKDEKTEYVFTRLRYPSYRGGSGSWGYRGSWTTDYPKADRHFVQGVRRLTRIHVRSVEHVLDLDTDDIYNYPWIYAVEVGHWDLSDKQAAKLRDYLLRGGFLLVDDFHGSIEWEIFMSSMARVFPEHPVEDIDNKDHILNVLYDLKDRFQVPGIVMFYTGRTYEQDGVEPRWRAIRDDKGRIVVAICHNMDLGDAWEHADHPRYPEKYSGLAYRTAINYIIYSMTH